MAQIIVNAADNALFGRRQTISDLLHAAEVAHLGVPAGRRFHRFVTTKADDVFTPADRTSDYLFVQVLMMSGRSVEAKKAFYAELYRSFEATLGLAAENLEVAIIETPSHDWAIRGLPGDEL